MNREEIIDRLAHLLRQHHEGLRGSIYQEPYRGDLFALFAEACATGLLDKVGQDGTLHGDAIADVLVERSSDNGEPTKDHFKVLEMWNDWIYVWRNRGRLPHR